MRKVNQLSIRSQRVLALTKKLSETFADEPDPLIVEVRNKVADLREAEVAQIEEARTEKKGS